MTYYVSSGTLNSTNSTQLINFLSWLCVVDLAGYSSVLDCTLCIIVLCVTSISSYVISILNANTYVFIWPVKTDFTSLLSFYTPFVIHYFDNNLDGTK